MQDVINAPGAFADQGALRACWQLPTDERAAVCSSFTLAKAMQFAIDNNARVVNLSLGSDVPLLAGKPGVGDNWGELID